MLPLLGVIITDGIEMNGKREYQRVGEGAAEHHLSFESDAISGGALVLGAE